LNEPAILLGGGFTVGDETADRGEDRGQDRGKEDRA
jgi:hypothetical protein